MKVPSVDEARKIVSDADLGVGCVTNDKELVLAQFVFNYAPSGRNPAFVFKEELQSIINVAEKHSEPADESQERIAHHVYNGFVNMNRSITGLCGVMVASASVICFILGIILYKLS